MKEKVPEERIFEDDAPAGAQAPSEPSDLRVEKADAGAERQADRLEVVLLEAVEAAAGGRGVVGGLRVGSARRARGVRASARWRRRRTD